MNNMQKAFKKKAMGGAETLDEIRNATHEFVDERSRPRGLANGGYPRVKPGAYTVTELPYESAPVSERVSVQAPQHTARAVEFQVPQRGPGAPISNRAGPGRPSAEVLRAAPAAPATAPSATGVQPRAPYASGDILRPTKQAGRGMRLAKGAFKSIGAPLAVASAIGDSAAEDSTARYARRFGVSEPTGDGSAGDLLKFAGLRAGGFASDLGNALTLGAAGNLYRDKPDGLLQFNGEPKAVSTSVSAPAQAEIPAATARAVTPAQAEDTRVSRALGGMGVSAADQGASGVTYTQAQGLSRDPPRATKHYKLSGGQHGESNADIYAASTRADGKLNSFAGVGNGNRPNWEQRNPADFKAATERASADKAKLVSLATSNINGTAEGLDRAYRLAAGDPEATAAVESAIQQQGLRRAVLNGSSGAASILAQQGKDATDVQVANITASGAERVGLAKARVELAKAGQSQANADRTHGLAARAADRADGKDRRDNTASILEGKLGKQFDKDGNLNPAYAELTSAVANTLQGRTNPDGTPMTIETLPSQELEQLSQTFGLSKAGELTGVRALINSLFGNDIPPSNEIGGLRVRQGTAKKSLFGGYTWQDQDGREKHASDLNYDQLIELGILQPRAQ